MGRKRYQRPGYYYHVFNRGNRKEPVFLKEKDYLFFIDLLQNAMQKFPVAIIQFCLMPNHYHILLFNISGQKSLTRCMHYISMNYTIYYNHKYREVGHVFQGPYKSKQVRSVRGLEHLFQYILLNPLEAKLVSQPAELLTYPWTNSSIFFQNKSVTAPLIIRELEYNVVVFGFRYTWMYPKTHWTWVNSFAQKVKPILDTTPRAAQGSPGL